MAETDVEKAVEPAVACDEGAGEAVVRERDWDAGHIGKAHGGKGEGTYNVDAWDEDERVFGHGGGSAGARAEGR